MGTTRLTKPGGKFMTKNKNSSLSTGMAAKEFNRRTLIKRGAALAAFAPVAPMFVKNAFAATSG